MTRPRPVTLSAAVDAAIAAENRRALSDAELLRADAWEGIRTRRLLEWTGALRPLVPGKPGSLAPEEAAALARANSRPGWEVTILPEAGAVGADDWGIKADDHFGGWRVCHGYYGTALSVGARAPEVQLHYVRGTASSVTYRPASGPGWVVEMPGDHSTARRIWRNRSRISEAVARHGGRSRIGVRFSEDGDRMTVTEYDWGRWSEELPADS